MLRKINGSVFYEEENEKYSFSVRSGMERLMEMLNLMNLIIQEKKNHFILNQNLVDLLILFEKSKYQIVIEYIYI